MNIENIKYSSESGDYEISILDIMVVLAENIRIILFIPMLSGLVALGISFLIPPTYQSVSLLALGEAVIPGMNSEEVMSKVLEKTDWIKASNRDAALKKLSKKVQANFDKKNNLVKISADAPTPQKAEALNALLINEYRSYSLPKGKGLEDVQKKISIETDQLGLLTLASKKLCANIYKVIPGAEGDNVTRAYVAIADKIATVDANLFQLKQSLMGFGSEVFIQEPTLPEKSIKPKKVQIAVMATLASGFLTILYVFIRAAFRNLKGDAEASEKLARIRKGIGLS